MRSLTLRKDTLAELTPDELSAVAGGTLDLSNACVTQSCTGIMCLFSEVICVEG